MHELLLYRLSAGTPEVVQMYYSIPVYIRMYVRMYRYARTYINIYVRMLGVKTGNNHVHVQYVTIQC